MEEAPPNTGPQRVGIEVHGRASYQTPKLLAKNQKGNPRVPESLRDNVRRRISEEQAIKLLMNPGPTPKLQMHPVTPQSLRPQSTPRWPQAILMGQIQMALHGL